MRELATVQQIKELRPIEGADRIELATFENIGWQCVVKKGEFHPGDKCVYFEIDSLLPERPEFEFLRKSSWNGRYGKHRLRTIKMKGVLSQGLALPPSTFEELSGDEDVGTDLTETLKVGKYEPFVPSGLAGDARSFVWPIPKTDETRIQSAPEYLEHFRSQSYYNDETYYSTVKLDGTSASFILNKDKETGEFDYHVCSRNFSLKRPEKGNNTYWNISDRYEIEGRLRKVHENFPDECVALQGEICGPGIQKNPLGLEDKEFFIFNIVSVYNGKVSKFDFRSMLFMLQFLNNAGGSKAEELQLVPCIDIDERFEFETIDELLDYANRGYSEFFDTNTTKPIEGVVFRLSNDTTKSFKVINNQYLLGGHDDE